MLRFRSDAWAQPNLETLARSGHSELQRGAHEKQVPHVGLGGAFEDVGIPKVGADRPARKPASNCPAGNVTAFNAETRLPEPAVMPLGY